MEVNQLEIPGQEKDAGNKFFKDGDYMNASKSYSKALLALNFIIKEQKFTSQEQAEKMVYEVHLPCLLNLSASYLKLGFGYSNIVIHCTDALKIQENNIKALYRRAIAYTYLDQFKEAKADIDKALEIEPNNPSVSKALSDLIKRKNEYKNKSKKIAQKFFSSDEKKTEPESTIIQEPVQEKKSWFKCWCCRRKNKLQ